MARQAMATGMLPLIRALVTKEWRRKERYGSVDFFLALVDVVDADGVVVRKRGWETRAAAVTGAGALA